MPGVLKGGKIVGIAEAKVLSLELGMLNIMSFERDLLYASYTKACDLFAVFMIFAAIFLGIAVMASVRKPCERLMHQLQEDENKHMGGQDPQVLFPPPAPCPVLSGTPVLRARPYSCILCTSPLSTIMHNASLADARVRCCQEAHELVVQRIGELVDALEVPLSDTPSDTHLTRV